jgi:hypothetical protein
VIERLYRLKILTVEVKGGLLYQAISGAEKLRPGRSRLLIAERRPPDVAHDLLQELALRIAHRLYV